ncbi:MAG: putative toxin-antitoxin system toxin component, PIN family [Bacteroidota bacterium]
MSNDKVEIIRMVRQCRDPNDDKFLELALNGEADYFVTGNEDLLTMQNFYKARILTPADFIELFS